MKVRRIIAMILLFSMLVSTAYASQGNGGGSGSTGGGYAVSGPVCVSA